MRGRQPTADPSKWNSKQVKRKRQEGDKGTYRDKYPSWAATVEGCGLALHLCKPGPDVLRDGSEVRHLVSWEIPSLDSPTKHTAGDRRVDQLDECWECAGRDRNSKQGPWL